MADKDWRFELWWTDPKGIPIHAVATMIGKRAVSVEDAPGALLELLKKTDSRDMLDMTILVTGGPGVEGDPRIFSEKGEEVSCQLEMRL